MRPRHEPSFRASTAQLGVTLLLISLGVLFAAALVAFLVTRASVPAWRPPGSPRLPWVLALSTASAVGASLALHGALRALRSNALERAERWLRTATGAGCAFLLAQAAAWRWMNASAPPSSSLHAFGFYLLTGLHAVHVLGGLVPLVVVLGRAHRRAYSSSRHEGVRFVAQYWDFLGVVWACLLTALVAAG